MAAGFILSSLNLNVVEDHKEVEVVLGFGGADEVVES